MLFQVHFLALLLEERGAGDLARAADHCHDKLVRRHPHVFGETEVSGAPEVLRNWDRIKRAEPGREVGVFGDVPETLPALLYARKVQRRAASHGFDWPDAEGPVASVREELAELEAATREGTPEQRFGEIGDLLFAAVSSARKLRVDPELALRAAADRFRERVEAAAGLAAADGEEWEGLALERQLAYYDRARIIAAQEGGSP